MVATIRYSITKSGSPSFPVYTVWEDPEDEHGYTIEHECVELAHFTSLKAATEFVNKLQNNGELQCQLVIN